VDVPLTTTAYEDPATRRAWSRTAAFRLSRSPGPPRSRRTAPPRFSFTDPERPDKTVSLGYGSFLFGVAQRTVVDDRMSARKRGVSAEARERAKAAGARVG